MGTQVTHGADTGRLREISSGLSGLSRQLAEVEQAGSSQLGTLVESWVGDDADVFAGDWQHAVPQLRAAADRMSAFARLLVEQAGQQDDASGGRSGDGWRGDPGGAREPKGSDGDPLAQVKDLMSSLTDGGKGLPDLSAASRPDPSTPFGGLNWVIDQGTDWANDVYTEHVRDNPFSTVPLIEKGLEESSDFLKDVSNKYREQAAPWDLRPIIVDIAADELDTYRKILHDPKGWWDDDASTLDKVGIAVSVVPVVGLVGKVAVKTTKEVFDQVTKAARRAPKQRPISKMNQKEVQKEIGGPLRSHEGGPHKGHTIERHVGKSDRDLIDRSNGEGPYENQRRPNSGSSTYPDEASAERATAENIRENQGDIDEWLMDDSPDAKDTMSFHHRHDHTTGRHVPKNSDEVNEVNGSRVLLVKDPTAPKGYRIMTSHPQKPR